MPEVILSEVEGGGLDEHSALSFRISRASAPLEDTGQTLVLLPAAPGSDEMPLRSIRAAGWHGKVITLLPPRVIYHCEQVKGFTWFNGIGPHSIELTSFGDSLWQLERFVLDLLQQDESGEIVLLGVGEGATLVLAALPYLHDRIGAAIAIDGYLPHSLMLPHVDLEGLPVWLIEPWDEAREEDMGSKLAAQGAHVRMSGVRDTPLRTLQEDLIPWLREIHGQLTRPRST